MAREKALARALMLIKYEEIDELGALKTIKLIEAIADLVLNSCKETLETAEQAEALRHGVSSAKESDQTVSPPKSYNTLVGVGPPAFSYESIRDETVLG